MRACCACERAERASAASDALTLLWCLSLARALSARTGSTSRLALGVELRQLLNTMHTDLTDGEVREVALQASGAHGWLVGHAGTSRGFYVLLDGREYVWSEVHSAVQTFCATQFSNIFLG